MVHWWNAGWYYEIGWDLRGFYRQIVWCVGSPEGIIHAGDALDFWRVLYANRRKEN
jgi:hypothetical protein